MATDATTYPAPLCACCEHALADVDADGIVLRCEHLGPICRGCRPFVVAASWALARVGLRTCAPLGPGLASGGLGACMALAVALPPADAGGDWWTEISDHGPALGLLLAFLGALLWAYGALCRQRGRWEGRALVQREFREAQQHQYERGVYKGYQEAVALLKADRTAGAERLPAFHAAPAGEEVRP